ncbi:MAG: transcriptional repressor [Acidobacteriota bacterium]
MPPDTQQVQSLLDEGIPNDLLLQVCCHRKHPQATCSCKSISTRVQSTFRRALEIAMRITKDEARQWLHRGGLRVTAPRMAVLGVLAEAELPLSHSEVLARLGETDWDPATIYRNLVKLRDAGVAPVVSRMEGIDRYALAEREDGHRHPHFLCEDCGRFACLPAELTASMSMDGPWAESIRGAAVQLRGECPDCLAQSEIEGEDERQSMLSPV